MRRHTYPAFKNEREELKVLSEDLLLRLFSEGAIEVIDHGEIPYRGFKVDIVAHKFGVDKPVIGKDSINLERLLNSVSRLEILEVPKIGFHYRFGETETPNILSLKAKLDEELTSRFKVPIVRVECRISGGGD